VIIENAHAIQKKLGEYNINAKFLGMIKN